MLPETTGFTVIFQDTTITSDGGFALAFILCFLFGAVASVVLVKCKTEEERLISQKGLYYDILGFALCSLRLAVHYLVPVSTPELSCL